MSKKSDKPTKLFVGKEKRNLTVEFGKYKEKSLIWVAKNDLDFFKQIENLYYKKYSISKKNHYDKLKDRFVIKDISVDPLYQERVQEAVSLLKQKNSSESVRENLQKKYRLNIVQSGLIVTDANNLIRKDFEIEKSFLLDIHMIRYEEIYDDNINPDLSRVQPSYQKAVLCEHRLTAMDTLFQKEKLLGIHTKNFKQKINSNKVSFKKDIEFDITKLRFNERMELLSLLNKAKPEEQLVRGVVANNDPLNTSDSKKENIIIIDNPIQQSKQTDMIGEAESLKLKSTGKNLFEVQEVMKKTLEEKVKELFEKKNKK